MYICIGIVISLILHLAVGINRQIKYVLLDGTELKTEDGTTIYRFLGIPYAYPPIKTDRFKEPVPITTPMYTVWDASFNVKCFQYKDQSRKQIIGREDCLYLNVYTTTLDESANYDVVVLIHGGKFNFGFSDEEKPDYLFAANKKMVFVSINYRLGLFGFLSTEDDVVPGNNGLKDQVVALKWVQENIHYFGGNPSKVTIAGMTAGGVSVHLHYLSPLSRNLFAQGISMSGSALSILVKTKNPRKDTENLAALAQCPTENSRAIVDCLRSIDAEQLLKYAAKLPLPMEEYNSYYMHFAPVIEKGGSNPFLNDHPFTILQKGQINNAPWLVSTPRAESYVSANSLVDKVQEINNNWDTIAPVLLRFNDLAPKEELPQISQKIRKEYFKDSPITEENVNDLSKVIGDRLYLTSIENAIRLHATASQAPVYFYTFDYLGRNGFNNKPSNVKKNFVDDYRYILKVEGFEPPKEDSNMIKTMVRVWQSYIEKGVPNTGIGITWPAVPGNRISNGDLNYVNIVSPSEIKSVSSPSISKRLFWNSLPLDEPHFTDAEEMKQYMRHESSMKNTLDKKQGFVDDTINEESKESNQGNLHEPQNTLKKENNRGFLSRMIFIFFLTLSLFTFIYFYLRSTH